MEFESCRVCGGDGRIGNAFGGSSTSCPGCNGTGRRAATGGSLLRDVTKTKESHHRPTNKAVKAAKVDAPTTAGGTVLANEITASNLSDVVKARLIREIIDYEASHGTCTQTFTKKIRKQLRGA